MKNIFSLVFCLLSFTAFTQEYFKVELESRSPDVKDLVKQYEGQPAIPFLASDTEGVEHSNFDYRDAEKSMLIFFWNTSCPTCEDLFPFLNNMQTTHQDKLQIVSFADEPKPEIIQYLQSQSIVFPTIANSVMFADGPYGGDLGYPRMFFVDSYGVNRWVLPSSSFENKSSAEKFVEALINQLVKI